MIKKWGSILLVATLFLLSTLACGGRLTPNRSEPTPTRRVVAVSQESAQQAQQIIGEAIQGGTLRMNEAQFTSLIATQLAQSGDVPVRNITVWFDPGQIVLEGNLQEGVVPLVSGPLQLKGTLAVANNAVVFDISEAVVNGFTLPSMAVNAFEERINASLLQTDLGNRVRSITINEGEIIIEQE
ncbi:MAG: hypothetical protein KF893_23555 [Caldilineaceae bacterium]|nr:hypothetical protein [Caldilineaceae bacterium]